MRNIAIFGGTFNPIHWGHLLMAETAIDRFPLDTLLWIPTDHPPHKPEIGVPIAQRLEMIQCAIADHPAFHVSDVDAVRAGTAYAIDILTALKPRYPDAHWHWLIGSDAFQTLPQWRGAAELARECTWLVAPRGIGTRVKAAAEADLDDSPLPKPSSTPLASDCSPALSLDSPAALSLRWHPLDMPMVGISSSLVRHQCQQGRSIRYLVPDSVRMYISVKKMYQMS